jgi:tetratricopeptide (TPR) repeat protein
MAACGRSPETRRDRFLAKGKELLDKKEYARALLEFKNASQALPNDSQSYYYIGWAATELKDYRVAVLSLRKAIDLDPKNIDAQLRLSQILAITIDENLIRDAHSRLQTIADADSASVDILNTLAFTELKLGQLDDAVQNLQRALAQSPGHLAASAMLARTKLVQNNPDAAEQVLVNATRDMPNVAASHLMLGDFYISRNRLREAETQVRRALELDPDNSRALLTRARLELTVGRKQEAEQSFRKLAAAKNYETIYGIFLFEEGRRDEAVRELERARQQNPESRPCRTTLLAAYVAMNRLGDASGLLDQALKKNPNDGDALIQRAELLIRAGKLAAAETDLNQVRKLFPASAATRYVVARLHHARGNKLSYRHELSETLRLNPALEAARVELARDLINSKEPRAALDTLNAAPEFQKRSIPVLTQRNWANWALNDGAAMRKGVDEGLTQHRSTDLLLQNGLWHMRWGDSRTAKASLEQALKSDPTDVRALEALYQSYVSAKQAHTGVQILKTHAAAQKQSAPVQEFLGAALMRDGDLAGARAAFEGARAADPNSIQAQYSLVQLDVLEKRLENARARLRNIVAVSGHDMRARLWLGNIEAALNNRQAAIEHYRKVIETDPQNAQTLNNLAYLLSDSGPGTLDQALNYAERAVEAAPEEGAYHDTLGWILYRKGVYKSAIQYLERANRQPDNVVSRYHLAMAYAKSGDLSRAQSTLAAALKVNAQIPEAQFAQKLISELK